MRSAIGSKLSYAVLALTLSWIGTAFGCATWLPSGEQPPTIENGLKPPPLTEESVVVETIVVRLNDEQQSRLDEFWNGVDQQVLSPELRLKLDRNGLRVAKITGSLPRVMETWLSETKKISDSDPLEKTGLSADVQSIGRQWRCRAGSKKEIPIRDLSSEKALSLFYYEDAPKGRVLDRPRLFMTMTASPARNFTADVKLVPELEHGEYQNRFIVRDAALRPVSERERVVFAPLAMQWKLQMDDCIVIAPTPERKGLGAEFLHSLTTDGRYEPVLLLVRLAGTGANSTFDSRLSDRR